MAPKAEKDPDQEPGGSWAGEASLGASAELTPRGQSPFLAGGEPRGRTGGNGCLGRSRERPGEEEPSREGDRFITWEIPRKQRKDDSARRGSRSGWGSPALHRGLLILGHILPHSSYFPFLALPAPCLSLPRGSAMTGVGWGVWTC